MFLESKVRRVRKADNLTYRPPRPVTGIAFHFFNNANLWDIAPCSPYVNRRFGGSYYIHLHGRKIA
jgi:hypothetical protein